MNKDPATVCRITLLSDYCKGIQKMVTLEVKSTTMKNITIITILLMIMPVYSCRQKTEKETKAVTITEAAISSVVDTILQRNPFLESPERLRLGVRQAAMQWKMEYGDSDVFKNFCIENYAATPKERKVLFYKLSAAFEALWGGFNKMSVELKKPLHLEGDTVIHVDYIFGSYDPSTHLNEDLYENKIAYLTILNFPFYSLQEKENRANEWSRLDWAYARMGDIFIPKPSAAVLQLVADAGMKGEDYIANYNIMMGHLLNNEGKRLFPIDMKLLSHWNLRDELKSNYAKRPDNFEKQQMIYRVMLDIVEQTIPIEVINNPDYDWNPYTNVVLKDGKEIIATSEGTRRYEMLLEQFKAQQAVDKYSTAYPSALLRAFDQSMQIKEEDIESMFIEYISSPKVKKVAALIEQRLGRKLEPFDIWYDGFKSRSSISEEELSKKTRKLFPTAAAFDKAIPSMLMKLGFSSEKAEELGAAIVVEPARGSGHAWGAMSRDDVARLRTRISPGGMDYKGFNIAVHEMGHNVEQTISMRDVDFYMMNGVPNTAFTEANAFVFQKRDLQLLGYGASTNAFQSKMNELDIFWGAYEIMGVALVDINVWKWLYANPDSDASQLKDAVISIAKDIWNKYYAPVLGGKDSPILAIYSHMIDSPLYLANYPLGHIIEYQLEKYYRGKNLAKEMIRIYSLGNLTPQEWMKQATGERISISAMLED
jgi:hypothetical protein